MNNQTTTTSGELVYVPIPLEIYDEVMTAVRTLVDGVGMNGHSLDPAAPSQNPESGDAWTENSVRRLASLVGGSARALLDLTSSRPNTWVSASDLAENTGRTHAQVRADLAGLTKLLKKQFADHAWPVTVASLRVDGRVRWHYCMSPQIAAWWREATEPA